MEKSVTKLYKEPLQLHNKNTNSPIKQNRPNILIDTLPKKIYEWHISPWKDSQCHQPPGKCKLKLEWLRLRRLSMSRVGDGGGKWNIADWD